MFMLCLDVTMTDNSKSLMTDISSADQEIDGRSVLAG